MKRYLLTIFFSFLVGLVSFADEGMWIPSLLNKYTLDDMHRKGFKLTADDIYSLNHSSLKDAIVLFGGGCTGEVVSDDGLVLTNHHCGYSSIQSHSTVEHDYLTNGFWAKSRKEELANQGLEVRFLSYMTDVTDSVLVGTSGLKGEALQAKIDKNKERLEEKAAKDSNHEAVIKPIFDANQYFLYVYKVYRDIRLVGAPPSSIGKFGGDTDNWMWPRHTGDFSIFRIYAGKNNQPADYSPDNVPYHPKRFLPISTKGIHKDDFVMIYGFPGSTEEYLPHQAVELIQNQSDPDRIKIRTAKLNILSKHMNSSAKVRIQYASKYARTSNSWKRWQGEIRGLKRMNAIEKKNSFEDSFKDWYRQSEARKQLYDSLFPRFDVLYRKLRPLDRAYNYYVEILFRGTDIFGLARMLPGVNSVWSGLSTEQKQKVENSLVSKYQIYNRDYDRSTDQEVFVTLINLLVKDLDNSFLPNSLVSLVNSKNGTEKLKKIYDHSILSDSSKMNTLIKNWNEKSSEKLMKDKLYQIYYSLLTFYYDSVRSDYKSVKEEIDQVQKDYMAGIMQMKKGKPLAPDANLTLRVAYGQVKGYDPRDAVHYRYYSTLKGIIEKGMKNIPDYKVSQKLKDLYAARDFGNYSDTLNNCMPVAFTATVHTTGGNSGSPVIDGEGNLVGINFDRCWEGTMSDVMFDPDQCRNIMLDIRYLLFIVDKYAGAGYLLNEMKLVN